jgi:S1-C subfamily serine protease
MQDHENEKEQEPAYGTGSPQPPGYGTGSPQPPGYGTGSHGEPSYGASEQQTDAFWVSNQQQPPYGAGSQQPPPYPGSWQPPGAGNWPPPPGSSFGQWGMPPQPPPHHRGRRALSFAVVAVLGVGIGAAAAFGVARNTSQPTTSSPGAQAIPRPGTQRAPLQNTGTSNINTQAIASAVSSSVVDVTSKLQYSNETAEGTGIVISSSGLVLTNNHVVDGSTSVTAVIDGSGRSYPARVLGTDRTDDIALLQLQGASGLKAASVGDSSKVAVGDSVVALGNAGGQGGTPTVTSGAITGLNRSITAGDQGSADTETLHGMLQTDAYIVAGDSGGPLVNSSGQVIGMDTAAASNNIGQSQNIGFAIPVNHALSIAREIASGQSSSAVQIGERGFLGVGVADISTGCQSSFGGGFGGGSGGGSTAPVNSGALVCNVYRGTPVQSAGVSAGDVITALNGTTVTSAESLTTAMQSKRPGNSVSLAWVDTSGQSHTATITLAVGPAG